MEVELKLLIDSSKAKDVRKHPLLGKYATSSPYEQNMSGIYFDTPENDIRKSGAGLRVRRVGDNWIQTFKAGGSVAAGLHQRHEWESRVAGPEPDLDQLKKLIDPKSPWGKLLQSPDLKSRINPIFTTHVKRTIWELRLPEGDEIEFALDQGSLDRDNQKELISEIELELKSGDPARLMNFALELQKDIPMKVGNDSKADRGYALSNPKQLQAVKATRLSLSRKMNIEQAFQAIVQNCLEQIQANESGVSRHHDVECLHQMRVGLRRLRSALGLFKKVVPLPEEMQAELAWLGNELGGARDWDVLVGSTLPEFKSMHINASDLEKVTQAALSKADAMHLSAAKTVDSARYTRLTLSFSRWMQSCEWRDAMLKEELDGLAENISSFSKRMLKHDQRRLLKRGCKLKKADQEARHRTRIAAKKMRYGLEFFQSLYPEKEVKSYLKALAALQEELGWLNDLAVADRLLKELQSECQGLASSAAYMRGFIAAGAEQEAKPVHRLWKKFEKKPLPHN